MTRIFRNTLLLVFTGTLVSFLAPCAVAQQFKATINKPSFDDLESPTFSGSKAKPFRPKTWLEVEAKIRILSADKKITTADRVVVRWFVAVKDQGANRFSLLTRDVEHVNVPIDEDLFYVIYLSPSSIRRITGSDRAGKNNVFDVGYEILVNGTKLAESSFKNKPGWWNTTSDKISRSDVVPLLTKPETPFSNMWWDRYAEVFQPRPR
jgi:hypothetical protein